MKCKIVQYASCLMLLVVLVACSGQSIESTTIPVAPDPVVDENTGAVRIKILDVITDRPALIGTAFYLADLIPVSGSSTAYIPAIDLTKAPSGESDGAGNIIISGKPGRYALIMYSPTGMILLIDSKTNQDLLITLEAGKITDMGTVKTRLPADFIELEE